MINNESWNNSSHADGWSITLYLRRQTGNRRIVNLVGAANDAHQNFYEDRLVLEGLRNKLEGTPELLALFDKAHQTLPPDLPMPDDRRCRSRHA